MGPRTDLDDVEKRNFLALPGFELDPSVVQPIASCYTDCAITAPYVYTEKRKNGREDGESFY
jgi:hypothetical protein